MHCPIDQTTLAMTERQGIEIDYCPTCRGVWLDRGELDKLIAGGSGGDERTDHRVEAPPQQYKEQRPSYSDDRRYKDEQSYKKRKKEGFLKDLFDF